MRMLLAGILVSVACACPLAGAPPVRHWAFEPSRFVDPPVDPTAWSESALDRFVVANLHENGLNPAPDADRRTLIRRITFDLLGLPPEPEEVEAFLDDNAPDALARLVDRLLASPRFGERQGRWWMDVVRYADTAGDNADYPVPEARLYRDYIIGSFNQDKPFDELVTEQLAGDILAAQGPPEKHAERVTATTFIALSRRYATAPFELMHLTLEDTIETTGRVFLGLTLRCARCHDHKFDPVTMEDYYGLYGIFASTRYPFAGAEEFASKQLGRTGFVPLAPPAQAGPRIEAHMERIRSLEAQIKAHEEAGKPKSEVDKLRSDLREARKTNLPRDLPCAYAVAEGDAADARIHILGDPGQPGPAAPRSVPRFLPGGGPLAIAQGSSGRLELARWITRPDNPLTARVLVNRIWQALFGTGIVSTPSNLGLRGDPPSHPELLDRLALDLVESGWSMKSMFRSIALSRVYRLACTEDPQALANDPANRRLWRHDRRRLDAESLRDTLLVLSGRLDLSWPGAHPFPDMSTWGWTQHNPFKAVYRSNHRSVYLMTQRIQRHPYCAIFDGPDTNNSTERRTSSTVPQQALFLLNSEFVQEQARGFAQRILKAAKQNDARTHAACTLAWGRTPSPREAERLAAFLSDSASELARSGLTAGQIELEAWTSCARVLLATNELLHVE